MEHYCLIHLDFSSVSLILLATVLLKLQSATVRSLPFPICPNLLNHSAYLYLHLVCVEIKILQKHFVLTSTHSFTNFIIIAKMNQSRKTGHKS